ncbi:NUDIX domain-containing protein [Ktedonosporobacter rubrisoli]|uniref:NUDIX domain-containing protein n=1 Tax=Ktedonosporobacter rubrisoli TaxID=2509675 RepID=A0A4P6JJF7_KTERU|nr:NUDIX hydrolase N-terminal domain-containing protein [Ktedonosporobacter rubrisoli]QBD75244.1 NUDIX domain-containing protein [Ktedonosporobacter rubrisoli]
MSNEEEQAKNAATETTLAQRLALLGEILRDCSARGLHFAANIYDRDNYRKIQDVALELQAIAGGQSLEEIEPLRTSLFNFPSPFAVGDGAVIDDAGKILLIRREDNGLWAMPGGGLEVGETPAEGAVREVLEETGIASEPVAFVGVHDSRLSGSGARHHLYHFLFLCRPLAEKESKPASHANEVLEINWFPEHALPEELDPGHKQRIPEAFRVWHGDLRAFFDPPPKK